MRKPCAKKSIIHLDFVLDFLVLFYQEKRTSKILEV